jgi:glycerate 2-kinase
VSERIDANVLVTDARAIAARWREEMDLGELTSALLSESGLREMTVDLVAIGKASREMSEAVVDALGTRVRRRITVCDEASARRSAMTSDVVVGEHPVPGEGSLRAGNAVLSFLDDPSDADATLFLVSGGASSLCVLPARPLSLDDLHTVWEAVLRSGADITTLNMIRAASSDLAGGAILRHVHTRRSSSFILVDNVVSGAQWVASALTYDFRPSEDQMIDLWDAIDLRDVGLRERLLEARRTRDALMGAPSPTRHVNLVLGEPAMMLGFAVLEAHHRGYQVLDMGASVTGDVSDVAAQWRATIDAAPDGPVALVGVGEVTVKVSGEGEGGRSQEFAWLMAEVLAHSRRHGAFVAQASDGRDYVEDVAGAWVDGTTLAKTIARGIDWASIAESHDTYPALRSLGQLIDGEHTGWNLCDIYVAVLT